MVSLNFFVICHVFVELFWLLYYNFFKEVIFPMKTSSTSLRLKQLLKERGLKQTDILSMAQPYCEKTGIKLSKNDLSQYVNGHAEPGQEKLLLLGSVLDVSEAWLMGYDTPMKRKDFSPKEARKDFSLIEKYSMLEEKDRQLIMELIDSLLKKGGH